MKSIKLRQIAVAVFLGIAVWGLFLFAMGQQAAHSAPLQQQPVLNISKQSAGNWLKRIKLVFTNTVSEELTDFPVLVVLDSNRIDYAETQDEGQDVRFVDADGTILPHEIESWDESGRSYVWVKVPSIPASSSTDFIWLYYGNPDAPDGQLPSAVWSANYRGIWHLNGNLEDATTLNDGQVASVTNRSGWIAGGQNFDGDQAFIDVGSGNSIDNVFATGGTVLAWINPRTFGKNGYGRIADKSNTTTAGDGWAFELFQESNVGATVNTIRFERDFFPQRGSWHAPVDSIDLNTWQLVAVTFDDRPGAQVPSFYLNGVATAVITEDVKRGSPLPDQLNDLYLGNFPGFVIKPKQDDRSFDGVMDEIRIVGKAHSADWVMAQYRSMTDDFIQYTSPEPTSLPPGGIVGAPLTYTLTVSNAGDADAVDVIVNDTLPAGANYVRGGQFSPGTQIVSWTIPNIAASTNQTVTFVVTTCELLLVNRNYQVVNSAGGETSPPGELAITLLTTPTLTAAFENDVLPVVVGQEFAFTSTSTTNGGPIKGWQWAFGDGGTAQGQTVTHTYSSPGIYTTTLTVTDLCGYTTSTSKTFNIFSPVLTVTKSSDPEPVAVGQRLNYTVVISNGGMGAATGVVVSDTLPAAVTLIPETIQVLPPGAGEIVGVPPQIANDITVAGQSLVTVTYGVTVNSPLASGTVLTNTVDVYGLQTPIPVRDIVTSTVINLPDLRISKISSHPTPLLSGDTITYTIVVSNAGDVPLTGVVISDSVPLNTRFVSDSIGLEPSTAGDVGTSPPLLAENVTIPGGKHITVTMVVKVDMPLEADGLITNTAVATSIEVPGPITSTVVDRVTRYDLMVTKRSEPVPAIPGEPITYTIVVSNKRDNDVVGAVVSDTLPAEISAGSWRCLGAGCDATSGVGDIFESVNLQSFERITYVVTGLLDPATGGQVVNRVRVSAPGNADLVPADNVATDTNTVRPTADLVITKHSEPLLPLAGQTLTYTVIVRNTGPSNVVGALISDILPAELVNPTWSCSANGATCPATAGTGDLSQVVNLPANSRLTYVITAGIPGGFTGELVNTATVTVAPGTVDQVPQNNVAVDRITVLPVVGFSAPEFSANEGQGAVPITVTLSGASAVPVTVTYAITDGTATVEDYQSDTGQLVFLPGATFQILPVTIFDDDLDEDDETVNVELTSAINARGTPTQTILTIVDDDTVNLSITKFGTPQTVFPGQRLTYTVVVKNNGNGLATGAHVFDVLPDEVTFISDSIVIEPDDAGDLGNLPTLVSNLTISGGAQITVTFAVTVSNPLTHGLILTNTAVVTSRQTTIPQIVTTTNTVVAPPGLQINKLGPDTATVGDTVQFTFNVINSGYARLGNVEVKDDITGPPVLVSGDTNNDNWLDLNEIWVYLASYTIQPTDPALLINTAVVTAVDPLNVTVTDRVSHTTRVNFGPVLRLTKTGPATAAVGETIHFTFTVGHAPTSDRTPVNSLSVTDDIAGAAGLVTGNNGDGDQWLEWGEVWTYTVATIIKPTMPNPLVNTGRVVAADPAGRIVTATAQHVTDLSGFNPSLFIDVDGPSQARLQERVTFTYTVINVNILSLLMFNLSEVGVSEVGDGSPIELTSITANVPTSLAVFVDGDFNRNDRLDAAEAWIYTASYTVTDPATDPLLITFVASGQDAEGDVISASETLVLDIIYVPDLKISSLSPLTATVGQMVPLTLTVSHANPSDDSPVIINSVTNSVFGKAMGSGAGDTNGNAVLDPGETWIYRFNYLVQPTDPRNLVHVTTIDGHDLGGEHFVTRVEGMINVDKPPLDNSYYLPLILKVPSG